MENAQILPQQIIDIDRVINFAKENGFPKASAIYWDAENMEYGMNSLDDILQEVNLEYDVRLGIELGDGVTVMRAWPDDADNAEILFPHNAKDREKTFKYV